MKKIALWLLIFSLLAVLSTSAYAHRRHQPRVFIMVTPHYPLFPLSLSPYLAPYPYLYPHHLYYYPYSHYSYSYPYPYSYSYSYPHPYPVHPPYLYKKNNPPEGYDAIREYLNNAPKNNTTNQNK